MAAYRAGLPILLRQQPLIKIAPSCCVIPRRHHDPRADKPWFQELVKQKAKEEKKTVTRKIDEMFDLEPALGKPEKVRFDFESVFSSKHCAVADETNPQWKDRMAYMCVPDTNMQEGIAQALWLTKAKLVGDGKVSNCYTHAWTKMLNLGISFS